MDRPAAADGSDSSFESLMRQQRDLMRRMMNNEFDDIALPIF